MRRSAATRTPIQGTAGAAAMTAIALKVKPALMMLTTFGRQPGEVGDGGQPTACRPIHVDGVGGCPASALLLGAGQPSHDVRVALRRRAGGGVPGHRRLDSLRAVPVDTNRGFATGPRSESAARGCGFPARRVAEHEPFGEGLVAQGDGVPAVYGLGPLLHGIRVGVDQLGPRLGDPEQPRDVGGAAEELGTRPGDIAVELDVAGDDGRARRPSRAGATGWCRRRSVRAGRSWRGRTAGRAGPGRRRRRAAGCGDRRRRRPDALRVRRRVRRRADDHEAAWSPRCCR